MTIHPRAQVNQNRDRRVTLMRRLHVWGIDSCQFNRTMRVNVCGLWTSVVSRVSNYTGAGVILNWPTANTVNAGRCRPTKQEQDRI